jgi:geranylgeranyl pyrophosphate synthase
MRTQAFDVASLLNIPDISVQLATVSGKLKTVVAASSPSLREPALRIAAAPSKRIRPTLVLAVVAAKDSPIDQKVIDSCVAIELVHLASLVHDDIIDGAKTRRGVATVNYQEGIPTAILVGDYLFASACRLAAELGAQEAQLVATLIATLCEGESQELAELHALDRSVVSLQTVMQKKTASLLTAACQIGGLCAGATANEITALGQYGEHFGIAFQLVDDVLDFIADPALLDKPVGADVREGNFTMPILHALHGPQRKAIQTWLHTDAAPLADLNDILLQGALQETISMARQQAEFARQYCEQSSQPVTGGSVGGDPSEPNNVSEMGGATPDELLAAALAKLPKMYIDWALNNLLDAKYRAIL